MLDPIELGVANLGKNCYVVLEENNLREWENSIQEFHSSVLQM